METPQRNEQTQNLLLEEPGWRSINPKNNVTNGSRLAPWRWGSFRRSNSLCVFAYPASQKRPFRLNFSSYFALLLWSRFSHLKSFRAPVFIPTMFWFRRNTSLNELTVLTAHTRQRWICWDFPPLSSAAVQSWYHRPSLDVISNLHGNCNLFSWNSLLVCLSQSCSQMLNFRRTVYAQYSSLLFHIWNVGIYWGICFSIGSFCLFCVTCPITWYLSVFSAVLFNISLYLSPVEPGKWLALNVMGWNPWSLHGELHVMVKQPEKGGLLLRASRKQLLNLPLMWSILFAETPLGGGIWQPHLPV